MITTFQLITAIMTIVSLFAFFYVMVRDMKKYSVISKIALVFSASLMTIATELGGLSENTSFLAFYGLTWIVLGVFALTMMIKRKIRRNQGA